MKNGTYREVQEYKRWKIEVKGAVVKAKEATRKEWYENLDTKEGEETIHKLRGQGQERKRTLAILRE